MNLSSDIKQFFYGPVWDNEKALDYYSRDQSVFQLKPRLVVTPKNTGDIERLLAYVWQRAKEGEVIPVTPRGRGTDQTGSAIGTGIIVRTTDYLNRLLEWGGDFARLEPGVIYGDLLRKLNREGLFLPANPFWGERRTVGGILANNAVGSRLNGYGPWRRYLWGLKVVLADGSLISTGPLTPAQLEEKKALNSLEGRIYRDLSRLLKENQKLVSAGRPKAAKNASGYALWAVERDNFFDLTPLFAGSEGTLGIIVEICLRVFPRPSHSGFAVGEFAEWLPALTAGVGLKDLNPSRVEVFERPADSSLNRSGSGFVLVAEFAGPDASFLRRSLLEAAARLAPAAETSRVLPATASQSDPDLKMCGAREALFISDAVVPPEQLLEQAQYIQYLFREYGRPFWSWTDAANGGINVQPRAWPANRRQREELFRLLAKLNEHAAKLDGTLTGEQGDGMLRALQLYLTFGDRLRRLFQQVKEIFDPYGLFNPRVKSGPAVPTLSTAYPQMLANRAQWSNPVG